MTETPKEAAKRLAGPMLDKGFMPAALHTYTDAEGKALYWRIRVKHPETGDKWIRPMRLNGQGYELAEPKFTGGKPLYGLHHIASNPAATVWYAFRRATWKFVDQPRTLFALTNGGVHGERRSEVGLLGEAHQGMADERAVTPHVLPTRKAQAHHL